MKTITLQEAYDIFKSATAVIVNDELANHGLAELDGDPGNEWLYCSWFDYEGNTYSAIFIEEDQPIKFDGQSIYMLDYEDSFCVVTPLFMNKKYSDFIG